MWVFSTLISAGLVVALLATSRQAQDVHLRLRYGTMVRWYDGEFYRGDSVYRELTIVGSGVSCDGPDYPNLTDYIAQVRLSGSCELGRVLLLSLIEFFAAQSHLSTMLKPIDDNCFTYVLTDLHRKKY